jgi:hypothetical protein
MQILKEAGIVWRERKLISKLHTDHKAKVGPDQGETRRVKTGKRSWTMILFVADSIQPIFLINEALEGFGDFKLGGQVIRAVKYAYDLLLAKEETLLQGIDTLIEMGGCYGVEMNLDKTKAMKISRDPAPLQIKSSWIMSNISGIWVE